MGVLMCGQAKILDQIQTHQIIETTSINDDTCTTIVDDKENVEQIMALQLLWLLDLSAKRPLQNDTHVGHGVITSHNFIALLHNWFIFIISLNIKCANVSIFCSNVCPLTGAILLNTTVSLVVAALNG